MSSVRKEITVLTPAAAAWDAVRDYGAVHSRLVPGMVTHTTLEERGLVRVVTFSDGLVLRERIVSVDEKARRFVYSIVGEPFEHHNASVEVIGDEHSCRIVWIADMLPHELDQTVAEIMERGLALSKKTIEASADSVTGLSGRTNVVFSAADRPTLHHVSLFVSDLDASMTFYSSGLGLTPRETFEDIVGRRSDGRFPFKVASVFLEAGHGRYIELHPSGGGTMSPPGFPMNHLALGVVDVDAAYERAIAAGATPIDIPIPDETWEGTPLDVLMAGERSEPVRIAFLQGPDGELIELYQSGSSR